MDDLWTSAKHIAQSDGRKDDWVYVVDIYKSIGGKDVVLMIFFEGRRLEVLGEIDDKEILVSDHVGNLGVIEKSTYFKSRKKFLRRDIREAQVVSKSLVHKGKTYSFDIYKHANFE